MKDEISKRCLSTDDIYDIVDGEATTELVSYFEEHIKSCEKCRSEYESIKKLKEALRDYASEPSLDFTKNTLAKMKKTERNPFIRITGSKTFKTVSAVAACLVLVFVVCGRGLIDRLETAQNENDRLTTISASEDYSLKAADYDSAGSEAKSYNIEDEGENAADKTEVVEEPVAPAEQVSPVAPAAPMAPEMPTPAPNPTPVDPSASNSAVVENPVASDAGIPVPENPLADDAYASVVENPDLIYLPTALQDKLTVIYSVNANGNYTILTAENINLSIHTDSIGESLYNDIQRRYALSQGIETPDLIETPSNVPATEVTEGPVPVEPETKAADSENVAEEPTEDVEEEIRVTPVKPTTPVENIELVDGFYITVPNSYNFRIQWYENGMFYNLELPMEYYGSDYSELTKIELVENPMK